MKLIFQICSLLIIVSSVHFGQFQSISKKIVLNDLTTISIKSGKVVMAGEAGCILYSENSSKWETQFFGFDDYLSQKKDYWIESLKWRKVFFIDYFVGWLAGPLGKLAKTTDGGKNWELINTSPSLDFISIYFHSINKGVAVGVDSLGYRRIYTTEDGGKNWFKANADYYTYQNDYSNIFFFNSSDGICVDYNPTLNATIISTTNNSGKDWQVSSSLPSEHYNLFVLNDSTAYLNAEPYYKTTDRGKTWVETKINFWASKIYFFDNSSGWIIHRNNCYLTKDGGQTWETVSLPINYDATLNDIAFLDKSEGYIIGNDGIILHTTDGGYSWSNINAAISIKSYKYDFINNTVGYCIEQEDSTYDRYLCKTVDGGNNWQRISDDFFDIYDIYFFDENRGYILYEQRKPKWTEISRLGVGYTTDGGTTWLHKSFLYLYNGPFLKGSFYYNSLFLFNNDSTGYFSWSNGVPTTYLTTDGGNTWKSSSIFFSKLFLLDADNFFSYDTDSNGNSFILYSSDSGNKWNISNPTPSNYAYASSISFLSSDTGFVIMEKLGHYRDAILKTTDRGYSWKEMFVIPDNIGASTLTSLSKFLDSKTAFALGFGHFLYTKDGGETWSTKKFINKNLSLVYLDENEMILNIEGLLAKYKLTDLITNVETPDDNVIINDYFLSQNYPNPFNPTTNISFSIPRATFISLKLYNCLGQELKTISNGYFSAGKHIVQLSENNLSSGVYFYKLTADNYSETKKLMIIK